MRKIFLFMMISLDGYFERLNHDLSWHNVDQEFNEFAVEQMQTADTLLFGRNTYTLMEGYWPIAPKDPTISPEDLKISQMMNTYQKIVYSKTLKDVKWENTTLKHTLDTTEIETLKKAKGQDIAVFGSNNLSVELLEKGLLDEVRIMVNPVVIGQGSPLFKGLKDNYRLKLLYTRTFRNGNVLLTYQPAKT